MASVWLDARTASTVEEVLKETPGQSQDYLRDLCGLPITTYFSALKLRWLLDNVKEVKQACDEGNLLFGTVDTWLLWVSSIFFYVSVIVRKEMVFLKNYFLLYPKIWKYDI